MPESIKSESSSSPEVARPLFDTVVVLGGNIRYFKNRGWVTTSYKEGEEKSIGAHARTRAAAELFKQGKAKTFILSTGQSATLQDDPDTPDPNAPTEAEVMKKEMIKYGVPEDCIILEEKSNSTLTNAIESAKIIKERGFKVVGLLTSFWHLERAMVMFESQRLDTDGVSVIPLSADDIIAEISKRHARVVSQMENSPTIKTRIKSEVKGIRAFKDGDYKQKPLKWNPTTS